MLTISKTTETVIYGIIPEFNSSVTSRKWLKSLILVSILLIREAKTISIKRDKLSMAVLHPIAKRPIGLFGLKRLYSVLFL